MVSCYFIILCVVRQYQLVYVVFGRAEDRTIEKWKIDNEKCEL